MRTFLTFTLFLSACVLWGQQSDLPFAQTPEHVIASAVEAWQSNGNIEAMPVFDSKKAQALISSERGNRSTITSVQQGIWSEKPPGIVGVLGRMTTSSSIMSFLLSTTLNFTPCWSMFLGRLLHLKK